MMTRTGLPAIRMGIGLLMTLGAASQAKAGGFIIRDQSAAGFGMAIAGVAAGDRLSYSYWNPAVLANITDVEVEAVATGIFPSIDIEPSAMTNAIVGFVGGTPTSSTDIGREALVPAGFAAYALDDKFTLGIAFTSPYGLATRAPDNWAGQVYSRKSEIFSLNANPMLSYKINDMVSIGGGVQIEYFSADLTQAAGVLPGAGTVALRANGMGIGYNLGIQITPWQGTTVGLGYRSSISHDVEGDLSLPGIKIPARTTLDTPDIYSLGIKQDVTEQFRLMGTIEWDNWSVGDLPVVAVTGGTELTSLHLDYRDGWLYSIGAEYDATDKVTVRGGIGYEVAPLTTENRDTRFPEVDQLIFSAGLTYKYNDRIKVDFSYLYSMGIESGDIDIGPDNVRYLGLPFQATSDLDVSIISVALSVKFDSPSTSRAR